MKGIVKVHDHRPNYVEIDLNDDYFILLDKSGMSIYADTTGGGHKVSAELDWEAADQLARTILTEKNGFDKREHVLNKSCWCEPEVVEVPLEVAVAGAEALIEKGKVPIRT